MRYNEIINAIFIERKNRFVATVELLDSVSPSKKRLEVVHVKNTGRLGELLIPGAEVYLSKEDNPNRKTKYDLIAVKKNNGILFNIDSQAANKVTLEWLQKQRCDVIKPEYTYGKSRIDFYFETEGIKTLMEIKGCTLEVDGKGYFPDAPTTRGVKHIYELIRAKEEGYRAILGFVIQMDGVEIVLPNAATDPEFENVFYNAKNAGVEIWYLCCHVEPDKLTVIDVKK